MAVVRIWPQGEMFPQVAVYLLTPPESEAEVIVVQNRDCQVRPTPDQFTEMCKAWLTHEGYEAVDAKLRGT